MGMGVDNNDARIWKPLPHKDDDHSIQFDPDPENIGMFYFADIQKNIGPELKNE